MTRSVPITVGILTFNSVETLRQAIDTVGACAEIIVCDGGSADGTREVAISAGCVLIDQDPAFKDERGRLTDIAGVREQVLKAASLDWVFFLDSDELATPALVDEMASIALNPASCGAYRVPRLFTLNGRTIECAMVYPSFQIRLVHRASVIGYHGIVHDVPLLAEGTEVGTLASAQLVPQPPFRELWRKWHAYMRLEEIKKANLTRTEWRTTVLKPGLRSIRWLGYRYAKSLRDCRGKRLPARYELGRLAYECGVLIYTGRRFIGIHRANRDAAWGSP